MVEVVIDYGVNLERVEVNGEELDIDAIREKPIRDWFQASMGRDGWEGLIPEIRKLVQDDEECLLYDFCGRRADRQMFYEYLKEYGDTRDCFVVDSAEDASEKGAEEERQDVSEKLKKAEKYEHRQQYKLAFLEYQRLADGAMHSAAAQYKVADYYFNGIIQAEGYDREMQQNLAVDYYEEAAKQGYVLAQRRLGKCFQDGRGTAKDEEEAVKWFRKAAEQGDPEAQCYLADCLFKGIGTKKMKRKQ